MRDIFCNASGKEVTFVWSAWYCRERGYRGHSCRRCQWRRHISCYHKSKNLAAFGFWRLLPVTVLEFAVEVTMLICSLIRYFVVSSALSEALIYFLVRFLHFAVFLRLPVLLRNTGQYREGLAFWLRLITRGEVGPPNISWLRNMWTAPNAIVFRSKTTPNRIHFSSGKAGQGSVYI